ncbi:hypothetical protein HS088_TW17G00340 [Tripterygium wilfordii]|uniref:Replication factor C subunit 3-like n=1 Tax=Tripterygium wilfordii TaxID=458696 RepID=A0A7J7CFX9_TRIWF|nr:replication factor C subunit 3-like [Tripterygium wilfordii]KAF5732807.1 hypothetical protein HS088_TW17G00340 [Tripterygium wilfordii]
MTPSKVLKRSSSDPNLAAFLNDTAPVNISLRSACSTSYKPSLWLGWGSISKLIAPARRSTAIESGLTEESLEAHNIRQAIIRADVNGNGVDGKNSKCSPYYKGLTDFSLIINREKLSSPERDSHGTSVTNSSSLWTLVGKVQEWGTCFSTKSNTKTKNSSQTSGSTKPSAIKVVNKEFKVAPKKTEWKPLRESESAPQVLPPLAQNTSPSDRAEIVAIGDEKKDTDIEKVVSTGREFVWADKYRPKTLKDFICNRDKAFHLQGLARGADCGHFIFEGPPGVGKRTMIWAMLVEAYGLDRVKTREEYKAFDLKGEAIGSIRVHLKKSSKHVEVNLSDLKGYEKHVIVELIKERHGRISNKTLQSKSDSCRAIILYEADKLSSDALLYMRWVLERYKGFNKIFFCCSDVSKLQPIKNLCTVVQLFPPSKEEIVEVLEYIAKQEGIDLPLQLAEKFADNSKNNLRQAIRSFEASWQKSYPFVEHQQILTGWEDDIATIAKDIVAEQSPKQLYTIRGKLQNLVEHDVSNDYIFKSLVEELNKLLDEQLKLGLKNLYQEYSKNKGHMFEGGRNHVRKNFHHFMRIEEFIAKFMSFYKCSIERKSMPCDNGS